MFNTPLAVGIVGLVVIVGVAAFSQVENTTEVIKTETREVEVTPDWAQDEDAVKAAQDVIRKKELEAEEARLVEEIQTRQAELDEIRKELNSY